MSKRFQLKRTRGWRMPPNGIKVARPSKWGNPYRVELYGRERAIELYRQHLAEHPELVAAARQELAGHDLGCFCRLDQACHADVLLEVANA